MQGYTSLFVPQRTASLGLALPVLSTRAPSCCGALPVECQPAEDTTIAWASEIKSFGPTPGSWCMALSFADYGFKKDFFDRPIYEDLNAPFHGYSGTSL